MKLIKEEDLNLEEVVNVLKEGKIIAFPTDTVYGIGCDVFNEEAVEKIYKIKGRDFNKPLPILLSNVDDIKLYAKNISKDVWKIIHKYLPGPLTIVVKKKSLISNKITAGSEKVAIRVLDCPILSSLVKKLGNPIVATSGNKSGEKDPITVQEVIQNLGNQIDLIIDGGKCKIGQPTTVIDLTQKPFKILRQGSLKINC